MIFYYIRHGDPIYNPDSLTPLGERQAEAVGRRLCSLGIKKIYSSTSQRAKMTATPLAQMMKVDITELDFANESHAWAELTSIGGDGVKRWIQVDPELAPVLITEEVRQMGDSWFEHPKFCDNPSYKKGIERIARSTDDLLRSLGYEHDRATKTYRSIVPSDEKVALFAHTGFGAAFLSCLLDVPFPEFSVRFDMTHTGVTAIEFVRIYDDIYVPKVLFYSDMSHIFASDLPMRYNNGKYV